MKKEVQLRKKMEAWSLRKTSESFELIAGSRELIGEEDIKFLQQSLREFILMKRAMK